MARYYYNLGGVSIIIFGLIAIIATGGGGDGSDSELSTAKIEIISVGWVLENIDPEYWEDPPPATCFYNFFIRYEGDDITANDIDSVIVYPENEEGGWRMSSDWIDTEEKVIGGYGRWYWNKEDSFSLPIGDLTAEIRLKNGHVTSKTREIPSPGKTTADGSSWVYSPEDFTPSENDYAPLLSRASVLCSSIVWERISIEFSVNHPMVYSGLVAFYNRKGDYVGKTKYFRNLETGELSKIMNSGKYFNNNGETNGLAITESDIEMDGEGDFSSIEKFIIILMDGGQYPEIAGWDVRSMTAKNGFESMDYVYEGCNGWSYDSRLQEREDGTVIDLQTKLIWLKNASAFGKMNWYDAMDAAATLKSGEYGLTDESSEEDWRLPTVEEFEVVTDLEAAWCSSGPCDVKGFVGLQSDYYWSIEESDIDHALRVMMSWGTKWSSSKDESYYVWIVRGPE